eukprot:scaffold173003_cov19-Tisochrysis_lutea.AAC.1
MGKRGLRAPLPASCSFQLDDPQASEQGSASRQGDSLEGSPTSMKQLDSKQVKPSGQGAPSSKPKAANSHSGRGGSASRGNAGNGAGPAGSLNACGKLGSSGGGAIASSAPQSCVGTGNTTPATGTAAAAAEAAACGAAPPPPLPPSCNRGGQGDGFPAAAAVSATAAASAAPRCSPLKRTHSAMVATDSPAGPGSAAVNKDCAHTEGVVAKAP